MERSKSQPITKQKVWAAYKKVKANKGGAGIDGISLENFEENLSDNLYKLWNRLASGSYFPPPVKEVSIPKKKGGERKLGIPTVGDRIAQMVVKQHIEPTIDSEFDHSSYGYRPGKSQHQALAEARKNCWKKDWVIDIDIAGFFDNLDHELLLGVLAKQTDEKWVLMYVRRWLKASVHSGEGIRQRDMGTPQGGVISPLLSNLFLDYAFDLAISKASKVKIEHEIRQLNIQRRTELTIEELAAKLNPKLRGWLNYYGKFRKANLHFLLHRLNGRIRKWASNRFKRFKRSIRQARKWLRKVYLSQPTLFAHWNFGVKP